MTAAGRAIKYWASMARILIIEDNADLVHVLSLALYQAGYEVHYAFNGQEGYDKILALQPDLVVLDLMLPMLSGTEILQKVSQNTLLRHIPVVVMTAYGDKSRVLENSVRAQGACEYLSKPFHARELLSIIRRTLQEAPVQAPPEHLAKGTVRLDPRLRTVWINDKRVATLAPKRAELLKILMQAKGPVKRDRLVSALWDGSGNANLLEKTVQRLREDLGAEAYRLKTCSDGYELVG